MFTPQPTFFENFRQLAYSSFGLDPAHFLTALQFAWKAMLKTTKVELGLLSEKSCLDFVERGIKSGIRGVFQSEQTTM